MNAQLAVSLISDMVSGEKAANMLVKKFLS